MDKRDEAFNLLNEYVSSLSLKRHCLAVAKAMEEYAILMGKENEEIDDWWVCGVLHDFDYEKFPSIDKHPYEGCKILKEKNYSESIINAIMGHGNHTGVKRNTDMAKVLFSVDELCGLIMALARVRPANFLGMSAKSLKKAIKKKDFAAGINRNDIKKGIDDLGVREDLHFENVINALTKIKGKLGFDDN